MLNEFNYSINQFLPYFFRNKIKGYPVKVIIEYKDNLFLKWPFFFRKQWYRNYFLIVYYKNDSTIIKISYKEKEKLKPLLKETNLYLKYKFENKKSYSK